MNIRWHNQRCHHSRTTLLNCSDKINLRAFIEPPVDGTLKCRITYDTDVRKVEYEPYQIKPLNSLKAVHCDLDYSHKFQDRSQINHLYENKGECDDILMIKDGHITDTSYGNVAFLKQGKWYTPENPLLKGTRLASLTASGKLIQKNLKIDQLAEYSHICIFNAMIPFGEIQIPVNRISVE
jgi:4-amino-4-deoxychorismate lyase